MLSRWVNGEGVGYYDTVWRAVIDTETQSVFRRNKTYTDVLGVADFVGRDYLKLVEDQVIIELLAQCEAADRVGGPSTFDFLGRQLSPNTIRYAKVLQDFVRLFPAFSSFEAIAEIGVGYGGQARMVSEFAKLQRTQLRSYDLIDILPVCFLAQAYLDNFNMHPTCRYLTKSQVPRDGRWDFVISNYAFSEFDADLEREYLANVLKKARSGYLTMNSGLSDAGQWGKQSYIPVEQLLAELPNAVLMPENPVVYPSNYIILFGEHCAGHGTSLEEMRAKEKELVAEYNRFQAAAKLRAIQDATNAAAEGGSEPVEENAEAPVNVKSPIMSDRTMVPQSIIKLLSAIRRSGRR